MIHSVPGHAGRVDLLADLGALAGCRPLALRLVERLALLFNPNAESSTNLFGDGDPVTILDALERFKQFVFEAEVRELSRRHALVAQCKAS